MFFQCENYREQKLQDVFLHATSIRKGLWQRCVAVGTNSSKFSHLVLLILTLSTPLLLGMSSFIVVCLWFFLLTSCAHNSACSLPNTIAILHKKDDGKTFLFFFIFTEQFKESCKIPFKGGFSPMPCLSLRHFCCLIELMFEVVIITVLKKPRLKMVSSSETASFREINVLIFMCIIRIFFFPSILLLPLWLAGKRKTVNKI